MIIGLIGGYVLGARAGRERYEQIKRLSSKTAQHPAVEQVLNQVGGVGDLFRSGVASGLSATAQGLRAVGEPSHIAGHHSTETTSIEINS
jgi:hypothetical protein